jgi:hypothetical protein
MTAGESSDSRAMHASIAARGRCGVQNRDRMRAVLDDDFGIYANMREQTGEIADGICLREVDRCHTHDDTSAPFMLLFFVASISWYGIHVSCAIP